MALKAREVRERLRGKVDQDVLVILEALAEEQYQQGRQLVEMANAMNNAFDTLNQLTSILEAHSGRIDTLKLRVGGDDA